MVLRCRGEGPGFESSPTMGAAWSLCNVCTQYVRECTVKSRDIGKGRRKQTKKKRKKGETNISIVYKHRGWILIP